jgi:CoA-dependent NAD(P)H sulfur oxidoreductase
MKIIIIGGIAAGMSAAAKLRRMDKEASITIYEKENYISFGACGLPYYVGDYFNDYERMLVRTPKQAIDSGIDVQVKREVIQVDTDGKRVLVKSLEDESLHWDSYDQLLIATGARAVKPPIENIDLKNVYFLRSLEDGQRVRERIMDSSIKTVGIIGAGFIGLEVVEAAKKLGKEVHVFQLEDRILKEIFDEEITKVLEEELREKGVHLHLNAKVTALVGEEYVQEISTKEERFQVDLVILATGVKPNTEFLKDTDINMLSNGAIVIDNEGRTSIEDIYAAGDCATVPHRLKENPAYLPLATNANKLGRIIGENLAGKHVKFPGTLGSSCIKVLDMEAGRTGLTEAEAKDLGIKVGTVFITDQNHASYYPGQEAIGVKLVYDDNTKILLGGQVVGRHDAVQRTNVLAAAIYGNMTTKELGMLDLCYAPPFARTWDALNNAGNVAK